jgi:hypothetical protein
MLREQKGAEDARQELCEPEIQLQHRQEVDERDDDVEEVLQTGLVRWDADEQTAKRVRDEQTGDELSTNE